MSEKRWEEGVLMRDKGTRVTRGGRLCVKGELCDKRVCQWHV